MSAVMDLTNCRFGRLVVLARGMERRGRNLLWTCRCDCGQMTAALGFNLTKGTTKSCGCLRRELASVRAVQCLTKHGHGRSNQKSPTYQSWAAMKDRCLNTKNMRYPYYGGQGITVCDRWLLFENFLADLGQRPIGTSLGRFGDVGNYEPGNVSWQTWTEQVANRRPDRNLGGGSRKKKSIEQIAA